MVDRESLDPGADVDATARTTASALVSAYRGEWGRIVATLVRRTGDWDVAEECTQGAFERAIERWPRDGVPDRPGGWLMTVARNLAMDHLRRAARETTKLHDAYLASTHDQGDVDIDAMDASDQSPELWISDDRDDRLRLLFTCCHPALSMEARVALTLRTLCGLSTSQIARAFLIPEATMAKRLVRAKHKIVHAGITFRVPEKAALPERTAGVLSVIYLMFNEGYGATSGDDIVRLDLADRALDLSRLTWRLLPEDSEVHGLLAVILFQRSRFTARTEENGDLVTLEDQDRSRWDREAITEAQRVLAAAPRRDGEGAYLVQATIASHHAAADSAADTDWASIVASYDRLVEMTRSPVVALNRAVAVAMRDGPEAGLRLVEDLEESGSLRAYHLLPATRADLLRRMGRRNDAARSYREALALVGTEPERRFLARRLIEVSS